MGKQVKRAGLTLVELLVVLLAVGILLAMLLPRFPAARSVARRTSCLNNIRNLCLAAANYESTNIRFPSGVGRVGKNGPVPGQPLSGVVRLLPYIEQKPLYDDMRAPTTVDGVEYAAFHVPLSKTKYEPWREQNPVFVCPSAEPIKTKFARTCYAFSVGDVARGLSQQEKLRGAYGYHQVNCLDDIKDGLSNTIGMVEIGGGAMKSVNGGCLTNGQANWLDDPSKAFAAVDKRAGEYLPNQKLIGRGSHWADGRAGVGLASTILPPNSPSFQVQGSSTADGIYSAGSKHPGGVNVAHLDGSVHFVSEDIDTGDHLTATLTIEEMESETPLPSPHGVWGAMGSINGGEEADYE